MRTKRTAIVGLHLWKVVLSCSSTCLWITTRNYHPSQASDKAVAVLRKLRDDYPRSRVVGVNYNGTIDA